MFPNEQRLAERGHMSIILQRKEHVMQIWTSSGLSLILLMGGRTTWCLHSTTYMSISKSLTWDSNGLKERFTKTCLMYGRPIHDIHPDESKREFHDKSVTLCKDYGLPFMVDPTPLWSINVPYYLFKIFYTRLSN